MSNIQSYDNLSDLYANEEVGRRFEQKTDFTIHRLEIAHPQPVDSPVFRANYYSFVLIKTGQTSYSIDGHTFRTKPGTLYFTNPGHLKSFSITDPAEGFLITVSEDYLIRNIDSRIFDEFGFLLTEMVPPCYLSNIKFEELLTLCMQIEEEYQKDSILKQKIISSFFTIFLYRIKEFLMDDTNFTNEYNRESQIVENFKKDLESNFRQLFRGEVKRINNVQEYAQLQNLHPNYLSTVIKTKTGSTPHAFIRDKTISEAKALLQNSNYSVKQVAYQLAYSDPANFSKFFKKETGFTPAAYRKSRKS